VNWLTGFSFGFRSRLVHYPLESSTLWRRSASNTKPTTKRTFLMLASLLLGHDERPSARFSERIHLSVNEIEVRRQEARNNSDRLSHWSRWTAGGFELGLPAPLMYTRRHLLHENTWPSTVPTSEFPRLITSRILSISSFGPFFPPSCLEPSSSEHAKPGAIRHFLSGTDSSDWLDR